MPRNSPRTYAGEWKEHVQRNSPRTYAGELKESQALLEFWEYYSWCGFYKGMCLKHSSRIEIMPRIYTRRRGKSGLSLKNALTYKNQNGLPHSVANNQLEKLGEGSFGSIYAYYPTNIVFKKHIINKYDNRTIGEKCENWEHEFKMHKKIFQLCNAELKKYDICIAKPYMFRYTKDTQSGLKIANAESATACIYTMDRIPDGNKWNKYFLTPRPKTNIPPYIYMGTLESGSNRITLDSLKNTQIINMPNDSQSFCLDPGEFGMHIQHAMIESFFIMLEHDVIPRDIEYLLDGRKHTETLIAIVDFNEVKTTQQRMNAYGDGYSKLLDAANVYIDLCGLGNKNRPNPMAPYELGTPQWKFLCNPIVCPKAFIYCMKSHRELAELIMNYAYTHKMKSHIILNSDLLCWKPLYVYRVSLHESTKVPNGDKQLGVFTDNEYRKYRYGHCIFSHEMRLNNSDTEHYLYIGTNNSDLAQSFDTFLDFDILFQYYIIGLLINRNRLVGQETVIYENDTFLEIVNRNIELVKKPVIEEWDYMSLF